MRDRSNSWINLATRGEFEMQAVAVINGKEYDEITAPVIDRSLFSSGTLSVGNCISASADFTVRTTDTIPKSAQVIIKARISDGTTYSEWKNFGTFWINSRTTDDDLITLGCYDAMMKANQNYVDDTATNDRLGWPKSMQTCVNEIAQRIGVQIDSRTSIKTSAPYVVPYPAKLTMMQVLGFIGGCHGGNWIITPDNKLRLVPLVSPPADSFDIIDYDYNKIKTAEGYKLVWKHIETQEVVEQRAGGGLINVPVVTGSITTAREYAISRVTMTVDTELGYTAGDSSGFELEINSNPYACQAICDELYSELNGIVYAPFSISGACYDPMAELGDWIIAGDKVRSVLCAETVTLDINYRAEASAPGEDELNSEYPYLTEIQKLHSEDERLQRYMDTTKAEVHSTIDQTRTNILLEVSETYVTQVSQRAAIELVNGQITAEVTRATEAEGNLSSQITLTADGITSEVSRATGAEGNLSSLIQQNADNIELKVSKDNIIASINASIEQDGSSAVKISADKVNLSGYATFTSLQTAGQTSINGANIQTGTITATQLSNGVNTSISTAQSTADGANAREQYIYISKASGTTSVSAKTDWVTDTTGKQNTWTTKRPEYNSSYPVLFIAQQSQTVAQKNAGSTCTCTTPAIDQTTTVIDAGHISTGTIDAARINSHTITVDKLSGSISNSKWSIDFSKGTFTIGDISANNITTGTLSADRIAANSIGTGKLSGSISNGDWNIDFSKGTFTIGDISANNITSGTLNVGTVNVQTARSDDIDIEGDTDGTDSSKIVSYLDLKQGAVRFKNGNKSVRSYIQGLTQSNLLYSNRDDGLYIYSKGAINIVSAEGNFGDSTTGYVDNMTIKARYLGLRVTGLRISGYSTTGEITTYTGHSGSFSFNNTSGKQVTVTVTKGIITSVVVATTS